MSHPKPNRLDCPACEGCGELTTDVPYQPDPDTGSAASAIPGESAACTLTCDQCSGTGRRRCEDCRARPADLVVDDGRTAVCLRCLAEAMAEEVHTADTIPAPSDDEAVAAAERDLAVLRKAAQWRRAIWPSLSGARS